MDKLVPNAGWRTVLGAIAWLAAVVSAGLAMNALGSERNGLFAGAAILAAGLVACGTVLRSPAFSSRAVIGTAAILAAGLIGSALLAHTPAGFARSLLKTGTWFWMFLFFVGITPPTRSSFCNSPVMLLGFATVLAGGWTAWTYWFA